ncbi:hypothetical protein MQE23_08505 [Streptomyces sp. HP-A2021]|uniref:hypothetical protein n=1 Tax=Streptomyces sp. HP-A2021 TaxID=2927875 RepID=UPI001FAFA63E|nr:hypothetical protein [Streptomyces sp. HP-A2021]UOB09092.1 hypothetical protein MQE23_08505 [Streptomyces sp. HP-A2021]
MSDTRPGADELRIRSILKTRGVGPDSTPPSVPRQPTARSRDWFDDLAEYNAPARPAPEPAAEPALPQPERHLRPEPVEKTKSKSPKLRKRSGQARHAPLTLGSPRQSLLDAYDRIPPRVKWLAYHASAAYLGWTVGLVDWSTYVTGWIAGTGLVGPQALFWYAAAGATVLVYRRTRRWWWPVAWLAAVPASSVVAGVLLYAPTQ